MGGATVLPDDAMKQPCIMIACFGVMSHCQANLDDEKAIPMDENGEIDQEAMKNYVSVTDAAAAAALGVFL